MPPSQSSVHPRGRDVLEKQLRAAGTSKVEHVLPLALNEMQQAMYRAVLEVRKTPSPNDSSAREERKLQSFEGVFG